MSATSSVRCFRCALLLVASLCVSALVQADDPDAVAVRLEFTENGETHRLLLTGEAKRNFLIFPVYSIAHYAQGSARGALTSPAAVLADGAPKALVIRFARRLRAARIREELATSLRRNARPAWIERATASIDRFLGAIDRDARSGDRVAYYWLPGGRLIAEFNGQRFFSAEDPDFARLLWAIWFGEDPVVDREALLARIPTAGRT